MHIPHDTAISTDVDVTSEITRNGFSIVKGALLRVPETIGDAVGPFVASYDDLLPDPYLPDGGRYRYRRHTRYTYDAVTGELRVKDNPGYFQTRENNPFAGGQMRKYEELDEAIQYNPFLCSLIAFNVAQLPAKKVERWEVQAHCVRIVARPDERGRPTPEGVHRDGCTFISLHMVRRHNVSGGETRIYSPDGEPITETLFTEAFDSFFGDDIRIRHGVGDVSIADPALGAGTRDMLLMSYDPVEQI
ncbi:2OG-Fe dioxygenase family protein [Streptomyces sp. NBC_01210]|uniref:2OG-Fe dioxygenase family protein n=1 Tax=Streptomyces sp. NBC_01210 TaxID=2903774 RepID=UPI002E111078|nr:2OG-Fe dioxygenase family protein [Streptomyces sp. NBC_01210]